MMSEVCKIFTKFVENWMVNEKVKQMLFQDTNQYCQMSWCDLKCYQLSIINNSSLKSVARISQNQFWHQKNWVGNRVCSSSFMMAIFFLTLNLTVSLKSLYAQTMWSHLDFRMWQVTRVHSNLNSSTWSWAYHLQEPTVNTMER